MSRRYGEAWQELRDKKELILVAPQLLHKRIYNGIRKERYKDLAHALFLAEQDLIDRVTYHTDGERMIFRLTREKPLKLTDLF